MFTLDKQEIKRILVDEQGYEPHTADVILERYPPIHPELAGAVRRWLDDRVILDVSVDGITIQDVMQNRRTDFLGAVRRLNRLLDDLTAAERDRYKNLLCKPMEVR